MNIFGDDVFQQDKMNSEDEAKESIEEQLRELKFEQSNGPQMVK